MSLIICPECGKKFSDLAEACPECGCPTSAITGNEPENKTDQVPARNFGQLDQANHAFNEGRFDDAYRLFSKIFKKEPEDFSAAIRMSLSAAGKDCFKKGIPDSTAACFERVFHAIKSKASSQEEFTGQIIPFLNDADYVIGLSYYSLSSKIISALSKYEPMRKTVQMIFDALFAPDIIAQRNLYEDQTTISLNNKIVESALYEKEEVISTLDSFSSYLLNLVIGFLDDPLKEDAPVLPLLGTFVKKKPDAENLANHIISGKLPQNVFGLCFGEETVFMESDKTWAQLSLNKKPVKRTPLLVTGHFVLTNYIADYKAPKEKHSFRHSLETLSEIKTAGTGGTIELIFSDGHSINIVGITKEAPVYAALLNEVLKMPKR